MCTANTKMASNSKSLEEMLSSEVDESAISALVGSLGTELERPIERPITQHLQQTQHTNSVSVNHISKANILDSMASTQPLTNNSVNNALIAINANSSSPLIANNSDTNKRIIINNNSNTTMNSLAIASNTNNTNKLLASMSTTSQSLPGALPASGYINQVTNSTNVNSIPANQIIQNAIKVSAMPNGSPNATIQQTLSGPQMSSSVGMSATPHTPHHSMTVTPRAPQVATTIALSAIPQNIVIAQNKTAGSKPGQTLLIATTKDGPMIVQPSSNPQNSDNNNSGNVAVNTTANAVLTAIANRSVVTQANSAGQQNLVNLISNTNPIQLQLVTNASRPTGTPNLQTTQKTLAPRVVQLSPNLRLTQQVIRAGTPPIGQGTITLPSNLSNLVRSGTIFVKTENGQVHMVNVAPQMQASSAGGGTANLQGATYRLQVPSAATGQTTVRNLGSQQHIVLPVSMASALQNKASISVSQSPQPLTMSQPLTIQTTSANQQAAATTPSQMSPNTAKKKCKNFLSTLIRLASDQPDQVANNVKNLIQGLIDDAIQPEDFTNQLQKELNSSPQPCLVPFLRKSLPYLRYSLMQRELTIEGVRPPATGAVSLPPQPQAIPQIQITQTPRPGMPSTVRLLTTPVGGLTLPLGAQTTHVLTPLTHSATPRLPTQQTIIRTPAPQSSTSSRSASKSSSSKSRAQATSKEKEKKSFSSSLRDDDDINDVAAMGGVNLQEESQRILATNAEIVGQQIRSCKDENFLYTTPLHTRINKIASKYDLEECPPDVVSLVSHAVQERLKTLVEKLGAIAEHRQEQLKNDPRYEVIQDVKGQIQFLQELDRIEKRKHEEQEREVLIKAAKSRSKADDPDHLAIKQRAKEMQRQEMEELRQKEANETALQAIGNPKKRFKTGFNSITPVSNSSFSSSSHTLGLNSYPFPQSTPLKPMRRIKRVSLRDLHFLMEQEKETVRTPMLYKAYAK